MAESTELAHVDFAQVIENANREGIDLQQVAIKYEGLTETEMAELRQHQEVTHELGGGAVLAHFPETGQPLFETKATAVLYLGA